MVYRKNYYYSKLYFEQYQIKIIYREVKMIFLGIENF